MDKLQLVNKQDSRILRGRKGGGKGDAAPR